MTTHTLTHKIRRQAGYTIDQTILIVAVIAILVTMIIGSVGWDLLTRAGGTKMQSHLVQFENAAGSFFSQYGLWPTDVTSSASDAVLALIDDSAVTWTGSFSPSADEFRNYLPAYEASGGTAQHSFGQGGDVLLYTNDNASECPTSITSSTQGFLVFVMVGVPEDEFVRAKEGIDGGADPADWESGRLQTTASEGDRTVTMCYKANATN